MQELGRRINDKLSTLTPELVESWLNPEPEPYNSVWLEVYEVYEVYDESNNIRFNEVMVCGSFGRISHSNVINDDREPGEYPAYQYNYNGDLLYEVVFFVTNFDSEKYPYQYPYVMDGKSHDFYTIESIDTILNREVIFLESETTFGVSIGGESYEIPRDAIEGTIRNNIGNGSYEALSTRYSVDEETGVISCEVPHFIGNRTSNGLFEITYKFENDAFICDTITYKPE